MSGCPHPARRRESLFPARDYVTGRAFEICRCAECGFVVTMPQPSEAQIGEYYPAGYHGSGPGRRFPAAVEWLQNTLYRRRARLVERALDGRKGRVLDIGCGRGFLLKAFRERGWEVQGTELSESSATFARDVLKLPVTVGPMNTMPWPDGAFDAVVMWHVLEHLPDPRAVLREAARVLRPGGALLAGVPNFGSPEARWTRDKWFHLDVPRHLTHLTCDSLKAALAAEGFELRRASFFAPEYDCFSFVQSAQNRIGLRHNLLYNLLRGRGAKVLREGEAGIGQMALSLLLAAPLGVLSVPAVVLAGLARRGATVTALALKCR